MAKLILPADAVPVHISAKMQADLVARGVFPQLRREHALGIGTYGYALYSMTVDQARTLEADSRQHYDLAHKSIKWAYHCLAEKLEESIKEVPQRLALLARAEPTDSSYCVRGDCFVGTKEQLQAVGIGVGMLFPGEPGAKRWFITRDSRGYPSADERRIVPRTGHSSHSTLALRRRRFSLGGDSVKYLVALAVLLLGTVLASGKPVLIQADASRPGGGGGGSSVTLDDLVRAQTQALKDLSARLEKLESRVGKLEPSR